MSQKALDLIARCKDLFAYKSLPPGQSEYVRGVYEKELPEFLKDKLDGSDINLYDCKGTLICRGFTRIVIGDYGAYVEFSPQQANRSVLINMPGQEYRQTKKYMENVKFAALTTRAFAHEKSKNLEEHSLLIYYQYRTVTYADYIPNMLYVSVYQIFNTAALRN